MLTFAQQKVVTGKVVDPQGQPVPFATVRIKGARGGVSADADGNFSMNVRGLVPGVYVLRLDNGYDMPVLTQKILIE